MRSALPVACGSSALRRSRACSRERPRQREREGGRSSTPVIKLSRRTSMKVKMLYPNPDNIFVGGPQSPQSSASPSVVHPESSLLGHKMSRQSPSSPAFVWPEPSTAAAEPEPKPAAATGGTSARAHPRERSCAERGGSLLARGATATSTGGRQCSLPSRLA